MAFSVPVPWRLPYDWLVRHVRNRDDLRRRGSEAVTPVMEFISSISPIAVTSGSSEDVNKYLMGRHAAWHGGLRANLRIYANQHPDERVRALGEALVERVGISYAATAFLGQFGLHSDRPLDAYNDTKARHEEATAAGEKLMQAIRDY